MILKFRGYKLITLLMMSLIFLVHGRATEDKRYTPLHLIRLHLWVRHLDPKQYWQR